MGGKLDVRSGLSRRPSLRSRPSTRQVCATLAAGLLQLLVSAAAGAVLPGQVSVHPGHPRFFFYHLGGPFFMAGPGDPEGFLYRGTLNADGTRDGDQQELLDKLAPTGANSIYLMAVRSHGGDGGATENPFVDNDPSQGLNDAVLDQWEGWFAQMDAAGITIFLFFYDDGSLIWNTGDGSGAEEAAFVTAIVDRFEHHRHLIWVVAEEYQERYSAARVSAIAAHIKAADDHDHPVAVHKLSGLDFTEFADDPALDQYAIQYNAGSAQNLHDGLELAWDDAADRYNLNLAEAAAWGTGAVSREKAWAAAMAGAYVMVYQMDIASTPVADMEDLGRLRLFMESTDFYTMEPRDDLATGDAEFVLAREGKSYIVYARQGTGALGLQDLSAGSYRRRWLDVATGFEVVEEQVDLDAGAQSWSRPPGVGAEAAVYLLRLDGANDRPETLDQSLATFGTDPLPVTLGFLDPDGPGPHTWAITSGPSAGTLSGSAPDLTYIADAGFSGSDAFTWTVNDGLDDSIPATVAISVGANGAPMATDFSLSLSAGASIPLPFAAHASDPEGQPLSFVIVVPPDHGQLSQSAGEWIYTADAGHSGPDSIVWLADDGSAQSSPATASLWITAELFADDFSRPDSEQVGNGWAEIEATGQAGVGQQALTFDSVDEIDRPLVRHNFARQETGTLSWSFDFGFRRNGAEGTYAFHMQLGDGAAMSDAAPDSAGVAVNLIWGGPSDGFSGHQKLGYRAGGAVVELAELSGPHSLAVEVDLDASTFALRLDGAPLTAGAPLDNPVPIDTVRFFVDKLNAQNFPDRRIDSVRIEATCALPDGLDLALSGDTVTDTRSHEVCGTIEVGPDWRVDGPGDVTLEAGLAVVLGNGVVIGEGARLAIY